MSSVSVGIVGLPNSGKSTLFNALLKKQIAQVAEYPYTTIEPNVGVVEVPDERLGKIAEVIRGNPSTSLRTNRPQVVPAAIRFIDIAGLIKGAHLGEGLGNQFLAHIREVDAILHVVRAFDPSTLRQAQGSGQVIPHVMGDVDPVRDVEVVNEELKYADIKKPTIYVLNVSESDLGDQSTVYGLQQRIGTVVSSQSTVVPICAKLEAELADLTEDEQKKYLKELGVEKSGLDVVIGESYKLLDLITFFTVAGGKMAQAWPLKRGSTTIEAAGRVHSDFEKGFIAAEVVDFSKLVNAGSWHEAKEKGLIKTVGRDQVIGDGQVIEFKFNV